MDRITNPDRPVDDRLWTEGDPDLDIEATPIAAKYMNDLQEEVCKVIEGFGVALDSAKQDQLYQVIYNAFQNANATSLDGIAVEMDGGADGYLLKITGTPGNYQVVAVPSNLVATPNQVAKRYFDTATEVIAGTTYNLGSTSAPLGASTSRTNAVTTANIENLIAEFASNAITESLTLEAGLWSFRMWQRASNASNQLRIKVFILNETSGVRTQIGATYSYVIGNTVDEFGTFELNNVAPLAIAPGERLVFSLYSFSTSNNRTITISFSGADRQSYLEVPLASTHNGQSGLQGGSGTERYHLTQAAAAAAEALVGNPPMSQGCTVEVFTASSTWIKPAGAKAVAVLLIGGGAGGSSGEVKAVGVFAKGGKSGAGASVTYALLPADCLPSSVAVLVGAGGVGGSASSGPSNNGAGGVASKFHRLVALGGYNNQTPTYTIAGGSYQGRSAVEPYTNHQDCAYGNALATPEAQHSGMPCGSAGGGITAAEVVATSDGHHLQSYLINYSYTTTGASLDGADATMYLDGFSGSGGRGVLGGNGTKGGQGGKYGCGGGGGGAARTGFQSGAGGNGAPGIAIITTYF